MAKIRKVLIALVIAVFIFMVSGVKTKADDQLYLSDGTPMYYKGTNIAVTIPDSFKMQETYYRGCWVTPLAGCLPKCADNNSSILSYKEEILEMFDVMEYYNLNALIFHIRIYNDALYPSELNPKSSYMATSQDLLPWIISECHKRGIEFHAWLNPYRVKSSGGSSVTEEASKIKAKCPANVGSNPDNLLINSSGGVILNPGIPEVRDFIVDTCMEVIEKYDVDAIHFDDYFYITGVDDSSTQAMYNTENLSEGDFRRKQVDLFIEQLSQAMRAYNEEHNRFVQLGISPSGIYRNGDGVVTYDEDGNAITTGSKTGGMQHWGNYLYSDTVNWINHEWIDYIMPQSYWAFSQPIAGFADVMSWWDKVCVRKNVNLYSGMGIYMSENPGSNYSWGFDPNEAPNQILYTQTLTHTQGTVFYNYNYLEWAINNDSTLYGKGLKKIKEQMFNSPAILPVIRTMKHVDIAPVEGLALSTEGGKAVVSFDKSSQAKFYVIYRSLGEITLAPEEVVAIIGDDGDESTKLSFIDETGNDKYNYAVRVQAGNNELSEARFAGFHKYKVEFTGFDGSVIDTQYIYYGGSAVAPTAPTRSSEFKGWGADFTYITSDLVVNAKYADSTCHVKYVFEDGTVFKEEDVLYGSDISNPTPELVGHDFVSWEPETLKATKDLVLVAKFELKNCHITFKDYNGDVVDEYDIKYGHDLRFPTPERRGYEFTGWSPDGEKVATGDMVFTAQYEPIYYTLTLINKLDDSVIGELKVQAYTDAILPEAPTLKGYEFKSWIGNYTNVHSDGNVFAYYDELCYIITFYDNNGEELDTVEYYCSDPFDYPTAPQVSGLEFVKWSFDINDIDNEHLIIDVYPIYVKIGAKVTFVDNSGNTISVITIDSKNTNIAYPEAPVVEGKTFVGWNPENLYSVDKDTVVTAIYNEIKVKFIGLDGKEFFSDNLTNGSYNKEFPVAPIVVGKKFVRYSVTEIKDAKSDVTVNAIYEDATVIVKYLDNEGKEIYSEEVPYGGDATANFSIPQVEGYKFKGFSEKLEGITNDLTVTLLYEQNKKSGCNLMTFVNAMLTVLSAMGVMFIIRKKH